MLEQVSLSAEVAAAIFGIAITVAAIVVQLAASRFNHKISLMFIRDPINVGVLTFLLASTLLALWAESAAVTGTASQIALVCVTLSLLILLPYFGYVITFISPMSLIKRLSKRIRSAIAKCQPHVAADAINQLMDVARNAIDQKDRTIAVACIDSFENAFTFYKERTEVDDKWFQEGLLADDLEFGSFEPTAIAEIERDRTWFESKVLHQFLNMMVQAVPDLRSIAATLGIVVGRLALSNVTHPARLDACIRTLNSFLRTTINARDTGTTYHLMSRYRTLIEQLIMLGNQDYAIKTVNHFCEYTRISDAANQPFIVEVAAYDLAQLGRLAHQYDDALQSTITDLLLTLDDDLDSSERAQTLSGVRRAQLNHAAFLLHHGVEAEVKKVLTELRSENEERLSFIAQRLLEEDRRVYWEYTPRGANFSYLEPEYRPALSEIMERLAR